MILWVLSAKKYQVAETKTHAFSTIGSALWNKLPKIRMALTLLAFQKALKTLFPGYIDTDYDNF